jgi:hypothetical protein
LGDIHAGCLGSFSFALGFAFQSGDPLTRICESGGELDTAGLKPNSTSLLGFEFSRSTFRFLRDRFQRSTSFRELAGKRGLRLRHCLLKGAPESTQ